MPEDRHDERAKAVSVERGPIVCQEAMLSVMNPLIQLKRGFPIASMLLMLLCLNLQAVAQAPPTNIPSSGTPRSPVSLTDPVKSIVPKYLTLGKTVRGRDITAIVYGSGDRRVLIFGGIHGDEQHTTVLARALAVNINSETLPPNLTVVVVPDVNPDGLMAATRVNANGVDINRNFPSKTWRAEYVEQRHYPGVKPSSEPETRAVLNLLERYPPHLVVTLHAALGCVNWDGPGGAVAQTIASINRYPLCESLGYETPGSLGLLTGIDQQIPTVTIELRPKGATALVEENLPALLNLLKHFATK
jgi:murein peptide amidase A